MPIQSAKQISTSLKRIPLWRKRDREIVRTFKFGDFRAALDFVRRIGRKAEKACHHPDIDIRYNKVTLALTTHDEGGLTKADFQLARKCDKVFAALVAEVSSP